MTDQERKAMEMALKALGKITPWLHPEEKAIMKNVIEVLRQALDHVPDTMKMLEPDMGIDRGAWDDVPDATKWVDELRGGDETEQEPVAWIYKQNEDEWVTMDWQEVENDATGKVTPLYTALAQPEQENEDYGYAKRLAQAIWEKHYKEESPDWKPKNDVLGVLTQIDNMTCGLEKAQPEQEPVAWMYVNKDGEVGDIGYGVPTVKDPYIELLYTAPPSKPWVSLTDEEIWEWFESNTAITRDGALRIARAIEAKLKEKNHD